MPEWERSISGHKLRMRDLEIDLIKYLADQWSAYIKPQQSHYNFSGTDEAAKRFALEVAERYLEHLLAQVRAMKEGTDASQGH